MDLQDTGRLLLVIGVGIALLGGALLLIGRISGGSLPGDIRVQTDNLTCFFPITTMIILSIILTIVLNIIIRWINR